MDFRANCIIINYSFPYSTKILRELKTYFVSLYFHYSMSSENSGTANTVSLTLKGYLLLVIQSRQREPLTIKFKEENSPQTHIWSLSPTPWSFTWTLPTSCQCEASYTYKSTGHLFVTTFLRVFIPFTTLLQEIFEAIKAFPQPVNFYILKEKLEIIRIKLQVV